MPDSIRSAHSGSTNSFSACAIRSAPPFVIVTHELASIFAIGNNSFSSIADTSTQGATGDPKVLRDESENETVRLFLNRGETTDSGKRMSNKASPTMIGVFTSLGLLIGGAVLVLLGAGKYFEQTHKLLLYFDKSVNGLQVGSDVRFGGVRIGRVSSISVIIDAEENRKVIPVVVELTDKELKSVAGSGQNMLDFSTREGVQRAVSRGLRAGMKQQSLVTGQLYVEFDIVPDVKGFTYDAPG